jgi:hypothetical protein
VSIELKAATGVRYVLSIYTEVKNNFVDINGDTEEILGIPKMVCWRFKKGFGGA